MNVLYLHASSAFSGSAKSLIEVCKKNHDLGLNATVLCPSGPAEQHFHSAGLQTVSVVGLSQFDHTRYGYYRGLRWLVLLRELLLFPFSLWALLRLRFSGVAYDILHINEATLLPLGVLAKMLFGKPLVVHVRSIQRGGNSYRSCCFLWALKKYADAVICIDETVRQSLSTDVNAVVIHNGLIMMTTHTTEKMVHERFVLGYVGSLLRLKGIYELLEAVHILCDQHKCDFKLLIFGVNVRVVHGFRAQILQRLGFSDDVEQGIQDYIAQHSLQHVVELRGFAEDVRDIYPQIDVLCFPSHLNAAGRPVFEAACFGIPSVVAMDTPLEDAIQHEITGLVINKPDPQLIAEAIKRLMLEDGLRPRLGKNAKVWAQQYFDIDSNAAKLYHLYEGLIDQHLAKE